MKRINLKYVYPERYKKDYIIEVENEIYKLLKKSVIESIDGINFSYYIKERDYSLLYEKISELTLKQQNRIYEVYILGYSRVEVAEIEGCSESAIRRSINRGFYQLRKKLKDY